VQKEVEERHEQFEEQKQKDLMNWEITPELQERLDKLDVQEKEVEIKVDAVANKIAEKMGYPEMPWLRVTWVVLCLYTVLTVMVMFSRSDFVNLTVCTAAIYMLFNTESLTRMRFRALVLGIIISLVYDLFWFIIKH
jgi:hypothetical protein